MTHHGPINRLTCACEGFTLVEATLSIVILAIVVYGSSVTYGLGQKSLDIQEERTTLDSQL